MQIVAWFITKNGQNAFSAMFHAAQCHHLLVLIRQSLSARRQLHVQAELSI